MTAEKVCTNQYASGSLVRYFQTEYMPGLQKSILKNTRLVGLILFGGGPLGMNTVVHGYLLKEENFDAYIAYVSMWAR